MNTNETTPTFDHQAALNGALVTCGDWIVNHLIVFNAGSQKWQDADGPVKRTWTKEGKPMWGDYPPLTTKPESDEK